MRLILGALTIVLICFAASPAHSALANRGTIEVIEMNAVSEFPDGIRFTVSARSSEEIDEIRVRFRIVGGRPGSAYRVAEFEPGNEVEGEAFLKSGQGGGSIPPGTIIRYSFEIRDEGNNVLRTPREQFTYTDIRFKWHTINSGLIMAHAYGENAAQEAEVVLASAQGAIDRMSPMLGIQITEPFTIVTYTDYRDMVAAVPFRAQAVREQLITQGIAFTNERVLLVHFDAGVEATTSHEFTHLLVAEATGHIDEDVPKWLNEGLAEYANTGKEREYESALQQGIASGSIRPLWFLEKFGGTPRDIIIAYGQSSSVVHHLINQYGNEKMAELMAALKETRDIDKALQQVYELDQRGLDAKWRESIGLQPLPTPEPTVASVPTPTLTPLAPLGNSAPGRQPQDGSTASSAGPAPDSAPKPTPSPAGVLGPASGAGPVGQATDSTATGCGAAQGKTGFADLAMAALMVGPLAGLCYGMVRGRRRGGPGSIGP
jgi:hypothetical protein